MAWQDTSAWIEPLDEDEESEQCPECYKEDWLRAMYMGSKHIHWSVWCGLCGRLWGSGRNLLPGLSE